MSSVVSKCWSENADLIFTDILAKKVAGEKYEISLSGRGPYHLIITSSLEYVRLFNVIILFIYV